MPIRDEFLTYESQVHLQIVSTVCPHRGMSHDHAEADLDALTSNNLLSECPLSVIPILFVGATLHDCFDQGCWPQSFKKGAMFRRPSLTNTTVLEVKTPR